MAQEQRRSQLRLVTTTPVEVDRETSREAYWMRVQALRAERDRLRAG